MRTDKQPQSVWAVGRTRFGTSVALNSHTLTIGLPGAEPVREQFQSVPELVGPFDALGPANGGYASFMKPPAQSLFQHFCWFLWSLQSSLLGLFGNPAPSGPDQFRCTGCPRSLESKRVIGGPKDGTCTHPRAGRATARAESAT